MNVYIIRTETFLFDHTLYVVNFLKSIYHTILTNKLFDSESPNIFTFKNTIKFTKIKYYILHTKDTDENSLSRLKMKILQNT